MHQGSARKLQCTAGRWLRCVTGDRLARALFRLLASPLGVWFAFSPGFDLPCFHPPTAVLPIPADWVSRLRLRQLQRERTRETGSTRPIHSHSSTRLWGVSVLLESSGYPVSPNVRSRRAWIPRLVVPCPPCAMSYCGSVTRRPSIRPPDVCPALASGVWRDGIRQHNNSTWKRIRARTG